MQSNHVKYSQFYTYMKISGAFGDVSIHKIFLHIGDRESTLSGRIGWFFDVQPFHHVLKIADHIGYIHASLYNVQTYVPFMLLYH